MRNVMNHIVLAFTVEIVNNLLHCEFLAPHTESYLQKNPITLIKQHYYKSHCLNVVNPW